jgi:hypothetical protein
LNEKYFGDATEDGPPGHTPGGEAAKPAPKSPESGPK